MSTLQSYKTAYSKAKTSKTRTKVFNNAMLNLSREDFQRFIDWQVNRMQSTNTKP